MNKEETALVGQFSAATAIAMSHTGSYAVAKPTSIELGSDTASKIEIGRMVCTSKTSGQVVVRVSTLSVCRVGGLPTDK